MAAARCEQYENGCPFRLRAMRSESGTSWSVSTESCEWKHVHPGKTPSPTPPDAYSESEPYKTIARRTVVLYDKPTFFSDASRFFLDIRDRSNSAYGYPCVPFRQLATSLTAYCAGRYGSEHCDYKIRAIRAGSGWKAVPRECNWTHSHDAKQIEAKLSPPVDERLPARLPMPAVPRSDFMKVSEIPFPDSLRPRTKVGAGSFQRVRAPCTDMSFPICSFQRCRRRAMSSDRQAVVSSQRPPTSSSSTAFRLRVCGGTP